EERSLLIPPVVKESGADIIFLQEVWSDYFRQKLIKGFKDQGYPYAAYSGSGWANGLLTISKYPLSKTSRLTFSRNTSFDETLVAKGAILNKVTLPFLGELLVVNTHLGATSFEENFNSFNESHISDVLHQIGEL